jgi:hypothetical protein
VARSKVNVYEISAKNLICELPSTCVNGRTGGEVFEAIPCPPVHVNERLTLQRCYSGGAQGTATNLARNHSRQLRHRPPPPRNLDSSFGGASNTSAKLSIETAFSSLSLSNNKVPACEKFSSHKLWTANVRNA